MSSLMSKAKSRRTSGNLEIGLNFTLFDLIQLKTKSQLKSAKSTCCSIPKALHILCFTIPNSTALVLPITNAKLSSNTSFLSVLLSNL